MKKKPEPRGHHFLPQFLLRAFARRISGDQFYVRVFHRDRKPHDSNVEDFGKQRDFHGDADLERVIAAREAHFARLHRELINGNIGGCKTEEIENFIGHLLVRTKNLRDTFVAMGNAAFDQLENPNETTRSYIRNELIGHLEASFRNKPEWRMMFAILPPEKRAEFDAELENLIEYAVSGKFPEMMKEVRGQLDMTQIAEKAHLKGLREANQQLHPSARSRLFAELKWQIINLPPHSLLLGDLGPLCRFEAGGSWRHPMEESQAVVTIVLPLAHDRLLLGQRRAAEAFKDFSSLYVASAELSRDFFVAARLEDEELSSLQKRIGIRSRYFGELTLNQ